MRASLNLTAHLNETRLEIISHGNTYYVKYNAQALWTSKQLRISSVVQQLMSNFNITLHTILFLHPERSEPLAPKQHLTGKLGSASALVKRPNFFVHSHAEMFPHHLAGRLTFKLLPQNSCTPWSPHHCQYTWCPTYLQGQAFYPEPNISTQSSTHFPDPKLHDQPHGLLQIIWSSDGNGF